MRAYFLLPFISLLLCTSLHAQTDPMPSHDWLGKWKGELIIYGVTDTLQTLSMELWVEETDTASMWNWTIIYHGKNGDDVRKYALKAMDSTKNGHYQVDERNSILLDTYLRGNNLSSRFTVNQSLLLICYTLIPSQKALRFNVTSGSMKAPTSTGEDVLDENIKEILSYSLNGFQEAILHKDE